jgi:hypothetical protein
VAGTGQESPISFNSQPQAYWPSKMAMKFDGVSETSSEYNSSVDYEHERRDAEQEHDEEPEQNHAPKCPADVA